MAINGDEIGLTGSKNAYQLAWMFTNLALFLVTMIYMLWKAKSLNQTNFNCSKYVDVFLLVF